MDFISPAGVNLISRWAKKELSAQEQSDFESLLAILAKQKEWSQPKPFELLKGKDLQGIGEIKWKSEQQTPLRVAGIKCNEQRQFILLVGFSHKGKVYKPPDAFELAKRRRNQLASQKGGVCEHKQDY